MRGATAAAEDIERHGAISIHAPHAGRDRTCHSEVILDIDISIHAPHAGRDLDPSGEYAGEGFISIHAPRAGRDYTMRTA